MYYLMNKDTALFGIDIVKTVKKWYNIGGE